RRFDRGETNHQPRVGRDVRNRIGARHVLGLRQLTVEQLDQPRGFADVTLDGVWDFLGRRVGEVAGLAEHRADIRHLPEEPFEHFRAPGIFRRQQLAGLLRQVNQYRARLEYRDPRIAIDDRGNFAVRANLDELRLELIAFADVHRMNRVLEAALLEHDGGFASVRRRPGVQIDHRGISFRRV